LLQSIDFRNLCAVNGALSLSPRPSVCLETTTTNPNNRANLAVGGQVVGDAIECPFHKWTFRGTDGQCTHIPYAKTSEHTRTNSYDVREWYGFTPTHPNRITVHC